MVMRKSLSTFLVSVIVMITAGLLLAGCDDFDPVDLVKADLAYLTTGALPEESGSSEAELDSLQQSCQQDMIAAALQNTGYAEYEEQITEEQQDAVEALITGALAKAKYEVSDQYTETEEGYSVEVTVYPVDFSEKALTYLTTDFIDQWQQRISGGEYTYTTEEQLVSDIFDEVLTYLTEQLDHVDYSDPVTMTVSVEETEGRYSVVQADLVQVLLKMLAV